MELPIPLGLPWSSPESNQEKKKKKAFPFWKHTISMYYNSSFYDLIFEAFKISSDE